MDLSTHHDKIINTINKHISHERDRASEAGSDREEHGKLLELTGVNKTAAAMIKKLHKMEEDKREDVLRSFDALRVEFDKNWGGQKTPDMFDGPTEDADPVEPAETIEEQVARFSPDEGDDAGDIDPDELAQDADDFEKHLAAVKPT